MAEPVWRRKVREGWQRVRMMPASLRWSILLLAIIVALANWSREPSVWRLVAPLLLLALAAAAAVLLLRRGRGMPGRALVASWSILALATLIAVLTTWQLRRVSTAWHDIVVERVETMGARLSETMDARVRDVAAAADEAAGAAVAETPNALFARLEGIRDRYAVEAVAALDSAGELIAWAGDHRGPLPERVRAPAPPPGGFYYVQRPLYTYLYAITPAKRGDARDRGDERGGPRAIVALLLEDALPGDEGSRSVAAAFQSRTGLRPRFGAGGSEAAVWQLAPARVEVAHATFSPMTQMGYRDRVTSAGLRLVAPLLLFALLLLWPVWERSVQGRWRRAAPLLATLAMLALLPLGSILGLQRPFSPGLFLLHAPGDWTLGRLVVLLVPITAWVAAAGVGLPRLRWRVAENPWLSALVEAAPVALLIPLVLLAFRAGAGGSLYEDERILWFLYQPAVVLAIGLPLLLLLPAARRRPAGGGSGTLRVRLLVGGLAAAALFGIVLDLTDPATPTERSVVVWLGALWAIPFALTARALRDYAGNANRLLRVLVAAWIAATAALPLIRAQALSSRLAALEREVTGLGSRVDPYLEFLVRQFAHEIVARDAAGERGVSLVYRAWVASGFAEEAYSPRITVWGPDGMPEVELTPGTPTGETPRLLFPPEYLRQPLQRAQRSGQPVFDAPNVAPDIQQIAAVPLAEERVATVVVPMRRALSRPSVLEPLLREHRPNEARLTLLPGIHGREATATAWFRTQEGWRGETEVRYPEATYHAHVELRVAPAGVRIARGVLLLALDLLLVLLLWSAGRIARLDPPRPVEGWRAWLGSYRARVTAALFAFFLVPTLVFGAVAYSGLAGEVVRAARLVAERSVRRAVDAFGTDEVRGDLPTLSEAVGADVLYYHRGELLQASTPEALDLGLYGAWMPEWVYRALGSGEELEVVDEAQLGEREYVVAYRSLPASGTLAVPAWPAAGLAATRQTELAHLMLFAALTGGLLSLALSLAVGRALAGPIGLLRRAAGAVGAGNLRVRLPERRPDEFGQLYQSFNLMIERLRQARSQEIRTARVLAWGEMARQVAHEIKNPLTPIRLAVQHVRRAHEDRRPDFDQILDTNVEEVLKEIDRLSEIARVFARYGAPAEAAGPVQRVRLAPLLSDVARLYAGGETAVRFRTEIEPELPDVLCRADELKEVMINLLENAREALDGSGNITIAAHARDAHVSIEVRDDGPGIPWDLLPRIFEPRFSSRSSGTGLGLAIVRRLVDGWGGSLSVDSVPGQGTSMIVSVPIAPPASDRVSEGGS
ncbi:MAG TPA: HAMP domain-containing sensor histidine kinase [Longimicrobiales bacterium]|nr:HAMP domain-containing sensor histidine kinase [Longimicrobiales bacterium]